MSEFSHASDRDATVIHGRALWPDHPAAAGDGQRRPSQANQILALLRAARAEGQPLPLPTIMRAGIAQHGARIFELRSRGHRIANEMARCDGVVKSSYRLEYDAQAGR